MIIWFLFNELLLVISVAKRVADKQKLTLNKCELTLEQMKPGHPPPLFVDHHGVGIAEDSLLYSYLPRDLQVDLLREFVSKAAGCIRVVDITFSTNPGVALVKYVSPPSK